MLEVVLSSKIMSKPRKGKSKVENIPTRTNPQRRVKTNINEDESIILECEVCKNSKLIL